MPAINIRFGHFLSADETKLAEFVKEFDKGALLIDVAPDFEQFLADNFQFLAFFVAKCERCENDAILAFLASPKRLADLFLPVAHDLEIADGAAADVAASSKTAEAGKMLIIVIQALADDIGNRIATKAHARSAQNTTYGDSCGPTIFAEFTKLFGFRGFIQMLSNGGTSRTAIKGRCAACCAGFTMW